MDEDGYCRWLSRFFFIAGYEPEDLYQEARIAVWLAPEGFERLCARRRIVELLRRSQRGGRPSFVQLLEVESSENVFDIVAARERVREMTQVPLSDLERMALGRVFRGEGCPKGPLDNALQRARRKLAA